ncbi:MAG: hypothetical protein CMJ74_09510 [Planctomycetaceae bacterium]|nr:hypothetical protein [Planctomycetaceae bacterium]|tara:strand:- start:5035 stop:6039 length:1005 start_codon:yes stop_codon:yes gene_type:complete
MAIITLTAFNVLRDSIMSRLSILLLCPVFALLGCSRNEMDRQAPTSDSTQSGTLNLVATTGQVNAALKKLTQGTDAKVKLFCGPGVDPHSFSASTKDIQAMKDADAIFYNGYHLEAKLTNYLEKTFADKSWAMSNAFPADVRLDWVEDGAVDPDAPYDPHIWNHLPGWSVCVEGLADRLCEIDPKNEATYRANCDQYTQELKNLHEWSKNQIAAIPDQRRVIVSAHDAFNYFAEVYGMKTIAVLGIGNDPEADIKTMRDVAGKVAELKIPVIFMENINNPKVTRALQEASESKGWKVAIAPQTLYSDDLGEKPPQDTFIGAFKSNVEVISDSLK